MAKTTFSSFLLCLALLFSISLNFLLSSAAMSGQYASPAVHIVYTEKPRDEEPEAYHIRTLVSVLGRFVFSSLPSLCPFAGKRWKLAMNFGIIC